MKKGTRNFWQKKQTMIAGTIMVAAAVLMTCMAVINHKEDNQQQELAQRQETIEQEKNNYEEGSKDLAAQDTQEETEEEKTAQAATFLDPYDTADVIDSAEHKDTEEIAQNQPETEAESADAKEETKSVAATASELHFAPDTGLLWPLDGSVIMNYSMDQTVYFATLDQYKYNPAVIISGSVNDKVKAAAAGKVTDISTNEETGCTLSMDLGDGYTAVYGQLKESPYQVGDYVAAGNTIGFVSEPTKYYSVEGSNLFFELRKDGAPVDPIDFFQ